MLASGSLSSSRLDLSVQEDFDGGAREVVLVKFDPDCERWHDVVVSCFSAGILKTCPKRALLVLFVGVGVRRWRRRFSSRARRIDIDPRGVSPSLSFFLRKPKRLCACALRTDPFFSPCLKPVFPRITVQEKKVDSRVQVVVAF